MMREAEKTAKAQQLMIVSQRTIAALKGEAFA